MVTGKILKFLLIGVLVFALSGCEFHLTFASTTISSEDLQIDEHLTGLWTTESQRTRVSLNAKGEPQGIVPVGEWYSFDGAGQYFRVARYMTFAIGGVSVEEGHYVTVNDELRLFEKTRSFFPDQGSPQKSQYREADVSSALFYRFSEKGSPKILLIQSDQDQPEIGFAYCP